MCNDATFSEALRDEIHLSLDELARFPIQSIPVSQTLDLTFLRGYAKTP